MLLVAWATWSGGGSAELRVWPVTPAGVSEAAAWAADARPTWLGSGYQATPDDVVRLLQQPGCRR